MEEITTNRNKRCCLCLGREVLTFNTETKEETTSLERIDGQYYCIDKKECDQNREAEQTMIDFDPKGQYFKLHKNGKTILEVDKRGEEGI